MDKNEHSIFAYVMDQLDENGLYQGGALIDDPTPSLPRPLGSDDAYIYTAEMPPDLPGAEAVCSMLLAYADEPSATAKAVLEEALIKILCVSVCDPLVELLSEDEVPEPLLALAEDWLYTAHKRELVKYAIVILAVFGLEKLRKEHSENLWDDLVDLCRCEEFTFFLTFAYRINNIAPQDELWELVRSTRGWGRIFTLYDLECTTEEEEIWLLRHGCEIEIDYAPICLVVMRKGQLLHHLHKEQLDYKTYRGCLLIINNFIMMLDRYYIGNSDPTYIDISGIDSKTLISELLRHAERYDKTPADLIGIINISIGLQKLITDSNWAALPSNASHELVSRCEKLIYSRDWYEEVQAQLFKEDGSVNYTTAEFAFELDIDIWERLFDYLKQHPLESALFPYLLGFENDERPQKVLTFIEKNINTYTQSETALLIPLKYLETHPGTGIPIVTAALTSIYDWPRGAASIILEEWGDEQLTPALRAALITARRLSQHPLITMRIDALLENKPFSVATMLEQLGNKN